MAFLPLSVSPSTDLSILHMKFQVLATMAAALLEAFTQQIDNLVLPIWYFTLLAVATSL